MSSAPAPKPSFSARRRWNGAFHAVAGTLAVAALVVMANYLAGRHPFRWYVNAQSELSLSPQTLSLLKSLTNDVKVTVLYDREEPSFRTVDGLLREYHLASPHIKKDVVYLHDAGKAQQVYARYNLTTNKNVIIFDNGGPPFCVPGTALTQFKREMIAGGEKPEFQDRPVAFYGEIAFTRALLEVLNPKPLKAYFLTGHDEHPANSDHTTQGYLKFATLLGQNRLQVALLSLAGTNPVPDDCSLLVIAGPRKTIPAPELDKIAQYLQQGGRLLALFTSFGDNGQLCKPSGLETVLAQWGVQAGTNAIVDPKNATPGGGDLDMAVYDLTEHPVVRPLRHASPPEALHLILPRVVAKLPSALPSADAPTVEEIAHTSKTSTFYGDKETLRPALPVAVAVKKDAVKGVVTERGAMRMIVVGDSFFLANQMIESAGNRDFAVFAVNWLLDRAQLLQLGPRPVTEFRLVLSNAQMQTLQALLLAGLPGTVLLVGGLVWLRRRN